MYNESTLDFTDKGLFPDDFLTKKNPRESSPKIAFVPQTDEEIIGFASEKMIKAFASPR